MKVLTCIVAPYWGGVHVVVERTTPFFAAKGFTRIIALPIADETMRKRLETAGASLIDWKPARLRKTLNPLTHLRYILRFWSDVGAIRKAIRAEAVDLVEVAGLLTLQPVVAAKLERRPLAWQFHASLAPYPIRVVLGSLATRVATVIMTSGKSMIARHGGLGRSKAPIIPFAAAIDTAKFRPDPAERELARSKMGYAPGDVVVGTLGNRGWQKRHEFILKIAQAMRDDPVRFAIVGSPVSTNNDYYRKAVVDPIVKLGLHDKVAVVDQFADAQVIMNGFDIFILPSVSEGLALVLPEALASGLPVVASDVGSMADLVDDSVGKLCDVNDLDAFVAGIRALIAPESRAAITSVCRARALERTGSALAAEDHFRAYAVTTRAT